MGFLLEVEAMAAKNCAPITRLNAKASIIPPRDASERESTAEAGDLSPVIDVNLSFGGSALHRYTGHRRTLFHIFLDEPDPYRVTKLPNLAA